MRIGGDQVQSCLAAEGIRVIDVRSAQEFSGPHFDQAENMPLSHLAELMQDQPRDNAYLVHCAGGYRSSAAVTLLQSMGFATVFDLEGGFKPSYVGSSAPAPSCCLVRENN